MGETQNPHFYDFVTLGRVPGSQNQQVLSLETPGYLKKSRQIPGTILEHIIVINLRFLEIEPI